jgi:N-acetylneuraminate synthase
VVKRVEPNEIQAQLVQRRCLRAAVDLKKGHILVSDDIIALRPISNHGFHPYEKEKLIGKVLLTDTEAGEHFTTNMISND